MKTGLAPIAKGGMGGEVDKGCRTYSVRSYK